MAQTTINTLFFTYYQNNSGGGFKFKSQGITRVVIIEATDAVHADSRAKTIGLYFDGCDTGQDCSCCGDRWYSARQERGTEEPTIYDEKASGYKHHHKWMKPNPEAVIHYLDGRIEWVEGKEA